LALADAWLLTTPLKSALSLSSGFNSGLEDGRTKDFDRIAGFSQALTSLAWWTLSLHQSTHRLSVPQGKAQLQLIRRLVGDQLANLGFLLSWKRPLSPTLRPPGLSLSPCALFHQTYSFLLTQKQS
jgi:hydrogenase/urease accessory protein HupE